MFSTGYLAAGWRYQIVCFIDNKLCTFCASSWSSLTLLADTGHSYVPFGLHTCRTGDLLLVMVSVPVLWMETPSFPGWKIVV